MKLSSFSNLLTKSSREPTKGHQKEIVLLNPYRWVNKNYLQPIFEVEE